MVKSEQAKTNYSVAAVNVHDKEYVGQIDLLAQVWLNDMMVLGHQSSATAVWQGKEQDSKFE